MYFNKVIKAVVPTNEHFWKLIKPFLTNKRFLENAEIMLGKRDKIVIEEKEIFNNHYIDIVERSCGTKPTNVAKKRN